ncbi:MAG: 3-oxoacyl-ACP reductase FabG [bacterium]|nr:3-oxoacyl-ACP reductase FabG [bacterium]
MSKRNLLNREARKIALITGASRGLGAAIALRLARSGYDIWANYQSNDDAAKKVRDEVQKIGRVCKLLKFDVSSEEMVNEILVPELEDATPDVLVNNAGHNKDSLMMWMKKEEWNSVIDVTLTGFFLVTKAVLMGMMKRRSGRIINISSTAGESGLSGQTNYSAAKAGLIGATKSLAIEVCKKGVIVNAVAPGFIETDMTADLPKDRILPTIPAGRFGRADEVAAAVEFLCSDDASYIVGQTISINGGLYT